MKSSIILPSILAIIFTIFIIPSCSVVNEIINGSASVTIDTGLINKSNSQVSKAPGPYYITSMSLTVTGTDMDQIDMDIPLDTGVLELRVPAGEARIFSATALTGTNDYFNGQAQTNLVKGGKTSVILAMELFKTNGLDIITPGNGSSVNGNTPISVFTNSTIDFASVEFYINNVRVSTGTTGPFSYNWDTTAYSEEVHTLKIVGYDSDGEEYIDDDTSVTVDNTAPSSVTITSPSAGSVVTGSVTLTATASDSNRISRIRFYVDSVSNDNLLCTASSSPYTCDWDTSSSPEAIYTIIAVAYDAAGNTAEASAEGITLDKTGPIVNIRGPLTDTYVAGTVSIDADASGASAIDRVEFYINGNLEASDDTLSYSYSWDTTALIGNTVALSAIVYDVIGLSNEDNDTSVTVTDAPVVDITAPLTNTAVTGSVEITANASDADGGIGRIDFYINDILEATDDTLPYSYTWVTPGTSGIYSIRAIAYDIYNISSEDNDTRVIVNNGNSIAVIVTDADLNNSNKSTPAPAVDLWAVTTRYETVGFKTEAVQLNCLEGTCIEALPLADASSQTVIVFDDAFVTPHPSDGLYRYPYGTHSHTLLLTQDYFSPCAGGLVNNVPLGNSLLYDTISLGDGVTLYSPRLPVIQLGVNLTSTTPPPVGNRGNKLEVYDVFTSQGPGAVITTDYPSLGQVNINDFCACNDSVQLAIQTTMSFITYTNYTWFDIYFTDDNFNAVSGACINNPDRVTPYTTYTYTPGK